MKHINIIRLDEGFKIDYFTYNTSLGKTLIASSGEYIIYVGFGPGVLRTFKDRFKDFNVSKKEEKIHKKVLEYIKGKDLDINIGVTGTDFQISVWKELLNIKKGEVVSYGELAKMINRPKAFRAVATCVGNNPVSYIIPCHRVIRSNGELGKYLWGMDVKKDILKEEGYLE